MFKIPSRWCWESLPSGTLNWRGPVPNQGCLSFHCSKSNGIDCSPGWFSVSYYCPVLTFTAVCMLTFQFWTYHPPGWTLLTSNIIYGGFPKCGYPQIIHVNRIFHYKPSILGVPFQETSICSVGSTIDSGHAATQLVRCRWCFGSAVPRPLMMSAASAKWSEARWSKCPIWILEDLACPLSWLLVLEE